MRTFGLGERERQLQRLSAERFDAAIVGGGITGAGVALDLASRGLSVALVERNDFASGTSSRSSKLIHGGLRYLAQYRFAVTREALHERHVLQRLAPALVEPVPFVIPVADGFVQAVRIAAGLALYDLLAGRENTHPFWHLAPHRLPALAPGLRTAGITTAYVYHDCRTDDARLTLSVLARAAERGAALANHLAAERVLADGAGRASGLLLRDRIDRAELELRARTVVLATGAWADRDLPAPGGPPSPPVRPSKGVHLFFPAERLPLRTAFYLPSGLDDRLIFVLPWQGRTLVGTTDTDFEGDLDAPSVEPADLDYLLGVLRRHFPDRRLAASDVVGAQAGLRPLVRAGGQSTTASREERVWERADGVIAIAGGKLTTYRRVAERVGDRIVRKLGSARPGPTGAIPIAELPRDPELDRRLERLGLPLPSAERLRRAYGDDAGAVAALAEAERALAEPIVPGQPPIRAEVVHAARHEQARRIGDVLARRTRLLLLDHRGAVAAAPHVAELIGGALGWGDGERRAALDDFAREAAQYGLPGWTA
ncbi:MAG TPA: glycerol-3-phosphate dehydrogenase/oxidase [Chloroflexota bacterium]|jgi:glycerol-3-phosphate dehydrogenase|nr:glycerol-3-phosphate dehydrogenase/oxidase [Chloroflexota bacterium]